MVPPKAAPNLFGMDAHELGTFLAPYGEPSFRSSQIYEWLYARRRFDPGTWTNLPRALRASLAAEARVDRGTLVGRTAAADGTVKYAVEEPGGDRVESVYMTQSGRVTLCISSQVGCALDCDFCLTGKMGFMRHLSAGEIVGQVSLIHEDQGLGERPFNIVFMGMGEPLHNYAGTLAAFRLLSDPAGFGISRRRITVSTSGLAPAIEQLASEPVRPRLAVSLNATTDEVRSRLMPVNRKYPLARLFEACRAFARVTGDRFTFEYVLLAGINDTDDDIDRLGGILRANPAKLNLIPFNPVPGWLAYRPPPRSRIVEIRDRLLHRGLSVSIRFSRGADARAACGQLALLPSSPDRPTRGVRTAARIA